MQENRGEKLRSTPQKKDLL